MAALLFFWVQSTWTHAGEQGNAFTDPDLIWQRMPPGWIEQTVRPEPDAAGADLAVTLDQQLYAPLLPHIREFAEERELKIALSEGTRSWNCTSWPCLPHSSRSCFQFGVFGPLSPGFTPGFRLRAVVIRAANAPPPRRMKGNTPHETYVDGGATFLLGAIHLDSCRRAG